MKRMLAYIFIVFGVLTAHAVTVKGDEKQSVIAAFLSLHKISGGGTIMPSDNEREDSSATGLDNSTMCFHWENSNIEETVWRCIKEKRSKESRMVWELFF